MIDCSIESHSSQRHQNPAWAMRLAVVITDLDIIVLTQPQEAPASRTRTDRPAGTQRRSQPTDCPHPCLLAALAASPGSAGWGRRRAQPLLHAPEQSWGS